jgi:hypothetical protein
MSGDEAADVGKCAINGRLVGQQPQAGGAKPLGRILNENLTPEPDFFRNHFSPLSTRKTPLVHSVGLIRPDPICNIPARTCWCSKKRYYHLEVGITLE